MRFTPGDKSYSGDSVSIECVSEGGNPAANFSYGNGLIFCFLLKNLGENLKHSTELFYHYVQVVFTTEYHNVTFCLGSKTRKPSMKIIIKSKLLIP